jgi:hypothetical protein
MCQATLQAWLSLHEGAVHATCIVWLVAENKGLYPQKLFVVIFSDRHCSNVLHYWTNKLHVISCYNSVPSKYATVIHYVRLRLHLRHIAQGKIGTVRCNQTMTIIYNYKGIVNKYYKHKYLSDAANGSSENLRGGTQKKWNLNVARELEVVARFAATCR